MKTNVRFLAARIVGAGEASSEVDTSEWSDSVTPKSLVVAK